jgi:hypothetical protein
MWSYNCSNFWESSGLGLIHSYRTLEYEYLYQRQEVISNPLPNFPECTGNLMHGTLICCFARALPITTSYWTEVLKHS